MTGHDAWRTLQGMVRVAAIVGMLGAGCFSPDPGLGLPCTETGACPAGQRCDLGTMICGLASDAPRAADAPADAPVPPSPFGAPIWFGSINSAKVDADASVTADLLELYFASDRVGTVGGLDIWMIGRPDVAAPFGAVLRVPELSSVAADDCPEVSPDGLTLYLTSARDSIFGSRDIFRSTRMSRIAAWGVPVLDADLSTAADEPGVSISADRRVAIIDRDAGATGRELYQRVRADAGSPWGPLVHLASLSSAGTDGGPGVDQRGLVIYFHSDRASPVGELAIYRATRASVDDPFSPPVPVGELDAPGVDDSNPWVSPDDQAIIFDSRRPGGVGGLDLYLATR